ncbi:MAG: antitoxin Xre/MbcA/ParS toxin-binding domain-containing protein [Trueperaceae bacterium]
MSKSIVQKTRSRKSNAKPATAMKRPLYRKAVTKAEAKTIVLRPCAPRIQPLVDKTLRVNLKSTPSSEEMLVKLREGFGMTKEEMADVLGLTKTTYGRREAGADLDLVEVHRVTQLEKTLTLAQQVFHDADAARDWFHNDIPSLQAETPLHVMSEPGGLDRVHNVLQRIYYGGY